MAEKTYTGFVHDVNDGEADILLDVPLDEDDHVDFNRYYLEHGESPDQITLPAERWMQPGTRLIISVARHPDDEPTLETRDAPE